MSPGPALQLIDSVVLAANGSSVTRTFTLTELPRVAEAGGLPNTEVHVTLQFGHLDRYPAVDAVLSGGVTLTCQRCLGKFRYALDETCSLVIVNSEQDAASISESHDAIITDPTRLDLRWLAEEQVLLALPFAPKHASDAECARAVDDAATQPQMATADSGKVEEKRQRPFANLRDLLDKH